MKKRPGHREILFTFTLYTVQRAVQCTALFSNNEKGLDEQKIYVHWTSTVNDNYTRKKKHKIYKS